MKCLVDGSREKQLYLTNNTINHMHRTCTVMLLRACTFQYPSTSIYWGIYGQKYTIYCPIIDTVTLLYIYQHPSVLEAATITTGSWSFITVQKSYQQLPYRRGREWSLKIHIKYLIIDTFRHYLWKAIAPEASNEGIPNLELELRRVYNINRMPCPFPVIYTHG